MNSLLPYSAVINEGMQEGPKVGPMKWTPNFVREIPDDFVESRLPNQTEKFKYNQIFSIQR